MSESRLQFRIGLFVVFAFFIFVVSIIFFGNKEIWKETYDITVYFRFTNGIKVGAPVRYSGVNIGKVKEVNILDNRTVALVLMIDDFVKLHKDVDIYIKSLGVIGETYVDIVGGSPHTELIPLKGSVPIQGKDPLNISELVMGLQNLGLEITGFFQSINAVVQDPSFKKNFLGLIEQLFGATRDFRTFLSAVNTSILRNNEHIDEIFAKSSQTVGAFRDSSLVIKNLLEGIQEGDGLLGKLFKDETLYQDVQNFVADLRKNPWKILYRGSRRKDKARRRKDLKFLSLKKKKNKKSQNLFFKGKSLTSKKIS